ncbi:uncharacterized protein PAE49_017854 [Odontesthes bonariensis]|uniref:uncharacterized protein LOC142401620 n=1 Tax=Odontesthes bonariensis TaxID=219752 RepID=UPI003F58E182
MAGISEDEWKEAMFNIFKKLEDAQFNKMVESLKVADLLTPQKKKTDKYRRDLAQKIVEKYGLKESISRIDAAMKEIPRNDEGVQDLLRPFVEKPGIEQEEEQTVQQPCCSSSQPEQTDSAGAVKMKQGTAENEDESLKLTGSAQPSKMKRIPGSMTIKDLKTGGALGQKPVTVKVVEKSNLSRYGKQKEERFLFHLAVADETDCIKVIVFGKERFQSFEKGRCYIFREVLMGENVLKVPVKSKVSITAPFEIPKNLELEAKKLFFKPVQSIAEVKTFEARVVVSVEGTVKKIGSTELIPLKAKREKKDKLDFELEDETGSISISLWGEDTKHLSGISEGDTVRVNNVKTNIFRSTVSLNSADLTSIVKVQSASVQSVSLLIVGITEAGREVTELDADINNQIKTLVVASQMLADVFGVQLDDNFQDTLVEKLPFSGKAEIRGNKIEHLEAA